MIDFDDDESEYEYDEEEESNYIKRMKKMKEDEYKKGLKIDETLWDEKE